MDKPSLKNYYHKYSRASKPEKIHPLENNIFYVGNCCNTDITRDLTKKPGGTGHNALKILPFVTHLLKPLPQTGRRCSSPLHYGINIQLICFWGRYPACRRMRLIKITHLFKICHFVSYSCRTAAF